MLATLITVVLALLTLPSSAQAEDTGDLRGYLGVRLGISASDTDLGGGLGATANEQVLGIAVGVNLNRYLGVEVAGDGWERNMRFGGRTIGEFAMYTGVLAIRARYPAVLDGRLSPYALAGLGVGYTEFNDRKRPGFGLDIGGSSLGVVGALGLGVDYFVANNIAIGIETKYIISRDQDIRLNGVRQSLDLDALLATGGIRLLFPETSGR
jgi:opacity protein-like surface antigen